MLSGHHLFLHCRGTFQVLCLHLHTKGLFSLPQSVAALMCQEINMSLGTVPNTQEWEYEGPSSLPFKWTNSKACIGYCFPGGINFQLSTEAAGFVAHMLLSVFHHPSEFSSSLQVSSHLPDKLLALKSLSQGLFLGKRNIRQHPLGPTLCKTWEYKTQLPAIREHTVVCNRSTMISTNCYCFIAHPQSPPCRGRHLAKMTLCDG